VSENNSIEKILCVSGALVDELAPDNQFTPVNYFGSIKQIKQKIFSTAGFFPRSDVERDPTYRQLIPYIVIRRIEYIDAQSQQVDVFRYKSANRTSIGIDGHINEDDFLFLQKQSIIVKAGESDWGTVLRRTCQRRIKEEIGLTIGNTAQFRFMGVVRNSTDNVGKVHLGVVYVLDVGVARDHVSVIKLHEADLSKGEFIEWSVLKKDTTLDEWSRLIVDSYMLDVAEMSGILSI